jgi:Carboxypeptidase regulatory-like domain/TonB dependent receptor
MTNFPVAFGESRMVRRAVHHVLVFVSLLIVPAVAAAQDSRGAITGRVADAQGGVLPGVTVTIVNTGTNSTTTTVSNDTGQYSALFLIPGTYRVTVELSGFRTAVNERVVVSVGDRLQLDFTLEPAGLSESVQVVAETPQLETGTASMGQVINSKLISEIPLGDGTAYGLTRLVPGATFERSYALQRPMDNDNLRGLSVTGTINSEFTIDGSSNVVSQARVGIQPPSDAIEEFKVETVVYDAQIGHTGAGNVNLALKSGTNQWHGVATYNNRDDSRSANLFASNRSGTGKQPRNYNRGSATLTGPIFKNRTFFMFSYERLQDDAVEAVTHSVPTMAMRSGDFSELLRMGVQIYDPTTARLVNGVVVREPFPGNIIPSNFINPIAANVLKYFPPPNQAGAADLSENYFFEQPWTYAYNLQLTRIDHEWASSQRTYGRFIRNFRREERYNYAGEQNGVEITRGATDRFNYNYAVGHTAVLSPSTVLDVKGSWLRFNDDLFPLYEVDPATLGYSSSTAALFRGFRQLPRYSIESSSPTVAGRVATLGAQQSGFNSGRNQPFYNVQFSGTLTKTMGAHTMKMGYDWRTLRQKEVNNGWQAGAYQFDGTYTRASSTGTSQYGQGIAAFVLGLPSNNSFIETRAPYDVAVAGHGLFVHDDWRVSDRLTLNLGLRYDLELGMTEAEHRNVGPFDTTSPNPIEAQAQAQFAANPPAGVPLSASQFRVLGGYTHLSDAQPRVWDADSNNIQPRAGVTFKLTDTAVLRGGAGLFIAPFQLQGVPGINTAINQLGYSRNTPVPVSSDSGLTFGANLSNPVPSGTLLAPVGSALGLRTNLGNAPGNVFPADRVNGEYWRYSVGVEKQFPAGFLVELSYIGQKGNNVPILETLNFVPQQYRTASPIRDATAELFLSQLVANPLQGLTPEAPASNGATIARRRLLYQFPQFEASAICTGNGTFCMETSRGSNIYHGAIVRVDKRFTQGFMLMTSYTWSRLREDVTPLNPWEAPEHRVGATDRPHRVTLASVTELPFGRNHRIGTNWNTLVDSILGGWQFSAKYEWQTGQPLVFNNNTYYDPACGDPRELKSQWGKESNGAVRGVDVPILDVSCFYTLNRQPFVNAGGQPITFTATEIQLGQSNLRTFPTTLPDVRFMNHHLLDLGLTKTFRVRERVRVQVRIEALNATNYTLFNFNNMVLTPANNASFMKLNNIDSSTVMKPRDIQIGARVTF